MRVSNQQRYKEKTKREGAYQTNHGLLVVIVGYSQKGKKNQPLSQVKGFNLARSIHGKVQPDPIIACTLGHRRVESASITEDP